jgi:hypothetical protein
MYTGYVMILALIPAVAGFIGQSIVGVSMFGGGGFRVPVFSGLAHAVVYYVLTLVGVYLLALIIDALAPSFGARKDFNGSLKVSVFSMTASWIAAVFTIIPAMTLLSIVGLYSLYLLYVGMKAIKEPPADKLIGYYVVTLVVSIAVYIVVGAVASMAALGGYSAGMMR